MNARELDDVLRSAHARGEVLVSATTPNIACALAGVPEGGFVEGDLDVLLGAAFTTGGEDPGEEDPR